MKYLIGIDGGATKTHCIITDLQINKLFECYGGPSNFLMLGLETVSNTILNLIDICINALRINYEDICAVTIGTTGAGRESDAKKLEIYFKNFLEEKGINLKNFFVESDARIALESAFSTSSGSILIAGTGSIMFGKDDDGNIHRVGGFGRFIGDEGSGYMLGKKTLIAVARAFDGRGDGTILSDLVLEKFKIDSPEALITEIYKKNFDIASVAPLLLDAGIKNDKVALKIIEDETDELIIHIKSMQNKLNKKNINLSFIGSVITNENIFSNLLKEKIKKFLPEVILRLPDYSPAYGAIFISKNKLNLK